MKINQASLLAQECKHTAHFFITQELNAVFRVVDSRKSFLHDHMERTDFTLN